MNNYTDKKNKIKTLSELSLEKFAISIIKNPEKIETLYKLSIPKILLTKIYLKVIDFFNNYNHCYYKNPKIFVEKHLVGYIREITKEKHNNSFIDIIVLQNGSKIIIEPKSVIHVLLFSTEQFYKKNL